MRYIVCACMSTLVLTLNGCRSERQEHVTALSLDLLSWQSQSYATTAAEADLKLTAILRRNAAAFRELQSEERWNAYAWLSGKYFGEENYGQARRYQGLARTERGEMTPSSFEVYLAALGRDKEWLGDVNKAVGFAGNNRYKEALWKYAVLYANGDYSEVARWTPEIEKESTPNSEDNDWDSQVWPGLLRAWSLEQMGMWKESCEALSACLKGKGEFVSNFRVVTMHICGLGADVAAKSGQWYYAMKYAEDGITPTKEWRDHSWQATMSRMEKIRQRASTRPENSASPEE